MKNPIPILGLAALLLSPLAAATVPGERSQGPCFQVNIQNDSQNRSSLRQNCDMNFARTVQAGPDNEARTEQRGYINSSKVRQYRSPSYRRPPTP
ncbi:hypothetical protein [Thioalkalivibrio sp.]|uniref:hypothetical protein n=2 Tax=Thioalkalivibrio sp. TaxID=2093813 RepID=UPI0039750D48